MIGILIMFGLLGLTTQNVLFPFLNTGQTDVVLKKQFDSPPGRVINTNLDYLANLYINGGVITVDLFENNAPNNVNNFVYLALNDYYDGTKFHRFFPGLLLQGGDRNTLDTDPENDGKGYPGYIIDDEINLSTLNLTDSQIKKRKSYGIDSDPTVSSVNLVKYTLAMASSTPDSNGSQFFIILADSSDSRLAEMNGKYTVIGQVIDGFATLNQLQNIQVDSTDTNIPRPVQPIVLNNVEIFTR
ncbi:peptidylprolyl isomerase [Candidatus Dojkabacteria bacterium]|uniref:peptidylprolyl isomerase n=1 Tax=Candidatus Dojkabacteria bacterium TaxID=2099670 RepID=A0A955L1K3_9BACT|nr:peptidylprolyl isomerase [Candidatus Dojkabacteria bacterium]